MCQHYLCVPLWFCLWLFVVFVVMNVHLCSWWNLRWNSWLCMCEWPLHGYQMSDVRNISLHLLWVVVISQFYDWIEVSCCSGYEADSWTDKIINRQNHVFVNVHNLMTQEKFCLAGERYCGPMYSQWLKCNCHKLFSKVIVLSFLLPDDGQIEMLH